MPYRVKVHFKNKYTAVTVTNGYYPYVDINNKKLVNLNVDPGDMFEISVPLIQGAGTVIVYGTDGAAKLRFGYAIPHDSDYDGNIYVPKPAAVSQSDFDKLTEEVNALRERIGP
ncbi:hypothetical protein [Rhizobium binae]|uniref:hypothetical protein n=1 Tax=Rhizobium binae TaxID=1138190 RepID=UPI001C82F710|nr:hypothetical protein [Rhizobium binae]MBX4924658.1 hypothetical protein [Rhizobium binae]